MTRGNRQSGNAFIMILIGIILFGALAFSFARSAKQGSSNISSQEAHIVAGDILTYAQGIEKAVNRMRVRGISESNLDFIGADPAYDNATCNDPKCEVFNIAGGQAKWQATTGNANDGTPWAISGAVRVKDVGTDGTDPENSELILFLPNTDPNICYQINKKLGVDNPADNPPATLAAVNYSAQFTGTFTAASEISAAALDGKLAGCFRSGSTYHFYQVLIAR